MMHYMGITTIASGFLTQSHTQRAPQKSQTQLWLLAQVVEPLGQLHV